MAPDFQFLNQGLSACARPLSRAAEDGGHVQQVVGHALGPPVHSYFVRTCCEKKRRYRSQDLGYVMWPVVDVAIHVMYELKFDAEPALQQNASLK